MKSLRVQRYNRIKKRVRDGMIGTPTRPRLSIHRTNKYIFAQAIDDIGANTILAYGSKKVVESKEKLTKTEDAYQVGAKLAELLKGKKIGAVIFDRGRFPYKGRIKQVAESLRANGITV